MRLVLGGPFIRNPLGHFCVCLNLQIIWLQNLLSSYMLLVPIKPRVFPFFHLCVHFGVEKYIRCEKQRFQLFP